MKIYILPVNRATQPSSQGIRFPAHNKDYGVEQDFLRYLRKHPELTTTNSLEADWHYLPIYWTRWHLNHNFAKTGLTELQQEISRCIIDDIKTFTVCQYDDGPLVNLGRTILFLSSRKTKEGIDIPLLCSPHKKPFFKPSKKYLASFIGTIQHHPIRQELVAQLRDKEDVYISNGINTKLFVQKTMESYMALCPRGYGGSSFRFFEAMQLSVVPFFISDLDTRPFKKFINWHSISLFSSTVNDLREKINSLSKSELLLMGNDSFNCWRNFLKYQKWCNYVIQELALIS